MPEPVRGAERTGQVYLEKAANTSIVTVSQDGALKAVSEGSATIMVYVSDKMEIYDQCTVIVERPKVTELSIEEMPVKTVYTVGEELQIRPALCSERHRTGCGSCKAHNRPERIHGRVRHDRPRKPRSDRHL